MKIKIKYFENALGQKQDPVVIRANGDWVDLCANETYNIRKGELKLIRLGVGMILPDGYEAHLAPRSSTFKKWHILQANSVGVIDNSYSGDNDEWMMPVVAMEDTTVERGDRICQFRIMERQPQVEFEEVKHLNAEDRGGFGSSGTK